MKVLFVMFTAVVAPVFARPQTYIPHEPHFCPVVEKTEDVQGEPWQVGVSVPGGGTIQVQEAHEVGTTWEYGGELGISLGSVVAGAGGFSVSVAETVTDSVAEAGSQECPDGAWHCSLIIYPAMTKLSGYMHEMGPNDGCPGGSLGGWSTDVKEGDAWSVVMPRTDASGNGVWGPELCTCGNLKHWADPGHPALLCKGTCANTGTD
ncbi:hypothetical protein HDK77DRAFT_269821 [Phyllosticta capitalensis]